MKTVKELIKTSVFVLLSMTTFANPSANIEIVAQPNTAFSIKAIKPNGQKVTVSIKDYKGVLLHRDVVDANRMNHRQYSMKELPSGEYLVKIQSANVIYLQPISVDGQKVSIAAEAMKTIFAPTVDLKDGKLDLNMLCLGDFNVQVDIRDTRDAIIYTNQELANGPVEKRFDTTEMRAGKYTMLIRVDDGVNTHEFYRSIHI